MVEQAILAFNGLGYDRDTGTLRCVRLRELDRVFKLKPSIRTIPLPHAISDLLLLPPAYQVNQRKTPTPISSRLSGFSLTIVTKYTSLPFELSCIKLRIDNHALSDLNYRS